MENQSRASIADRERIDSPPLDPADNAAWTAYRSRQRDGVVIADDLPDRLPVTAEEIGLLRAFLGSGIDAILRGE